MMPLFGKSCLFKYYIITKIYDGKRTEETGGDNPK